MLATRTRLRVLLFLIGALVVSGCAEGNDLFGRELYLEACASCHLREEVDWGPGSGRADALTDAEMEATIRDGVDSMPAFGSSYSQEQIDSLIAHLRSLGQPAGN